MVISQTQESTWLHILRDCPAMDAMATEFLVIAPHPDDETLAVGGLIAGLRRQGAPVRVVAVTDGENAYAGDRDLGPIRVREQTLALEKLGVSSSNIVRLGLPDSGIAACEDVLVAQLLEFVSADTHILAPWSGDFHPDHEACGRAAQKVARRVGASLSYWLFWAWHRGDPDIIGRLGLRSFALTEDLMKAKAEALLCHQSQLVHRSGEPILPEDLLAPARRPFEVFIPS